MTGEFQLDLFEAPPPPPPEPRPADAMVELLESKGLGNGWLLANNRTLGGWGECKEIPSRLFQFPIEFVERDRLGSDFSVLYLNHELIGEHPLVQRVQELIGQAIPWCPVDEFGRDRGAKWRYFHALDLATNDRFSILMDSLEYTDADAMAGGMDYALRYGHLSPGRARTALITMGLEEPADRSAAALDAGVLNPSPIYMDDKGKPTKKPRFGMNAGGRRDQFPAHALTWAFLHGLEDGWFTHDRAGFLTMTPAGIERLGVELRD